MESGQHAVDLGSWAAVRVQGGPDGLRPTGLRVQPAVAPEAWSELVQAAGPDVFLRWTVTIDGQPVADRRYRARLQGPWQAEVEPVSPAA